MSQPGNSPKLEGTKTSKKSKNLRKKSGGIKVRVKLPSLETYEKEVEFRAEGPGRIIVRLERLMGSDRIRLTDPKFMSLLLEKLEEEERKSWTERTIARKKAERNRSRELAILGLMEPGDDMQDLYKHPVFRVNRVLKKLAAFDQTMSIGQQINLPPIILIEPFETDGSGAIFKTFPRHAELKRGAPPEEELEKKTSVDGATEPEPPAPQIIGSKLLGAGGEDAIAAPVSITAGADDEQEDEEEEVEDAMTPIPTMADVDMSIVEDDEEEEGEEGEAKEKAEIGHVKTVAAKQPLTDLQMSYGIPSKEDLSRWEGFRSDLVDTIYTDDESGVLQLYQAAEEILSVYERENLTVDDFVVKLNRMLGAGGGGNLST